MHGNILEEGIHVPKKGEEIWSQYNPWGKMIKVKRDPYFSPTAFWGDPTDDFFNDSSISLISNGTSILFSFLKNFYWGEISKNTKREREALGIRHPASTIVSS